MKKVWEVYENDVVVMSLQFYLIFGLNLVVVGFFLVLFSVVLLFFSSVIGVVFYSFFMQVFEQEMVQVFIFVQVVGVIIGKKGQYIKQFFWFVSVFIKIVLFEIFDFKVCMVIIIGLLEV